MNLQFILKEPFLTRSCLTRIDGKCIFHVSVMNPGEDELLFKLDLKRSADANDTKPSQFREGKAKKAKLEENLST